MVRVVLVSLLALLALASCASLSEKSCRAGDWETVGFRDGDAGRHPDFIEKHARACNDHGIAPNKTVWQRGYVAGLKHYCTPFRAYHEGRTGDRLNAVCPAEGIEALYRANDRGLEWHRLERDIHDNERRIHRINDALAGLADGDTARATLTRERSLLRLENLRLRSRQIGYRY